MSLNLKKNVSAADQDGAISLRKGDAPVSLAKGRSVRVINLWTHPRKDYDLKALVRYRDGRTVYVGAAAEDEVKRTAEGAVEHSGDVRHSGEPEVVTVRWHKDIASVALSSYSAIENGTGSFHEYGVSVLIDNGVTRHAIGAVDTSTHPNSYTMCFGEILFGETEGDLSIRPMEMYSKPSSENRIAYEGDKVVMDKGPRGTTKS